MYRQKIAQKTSPLVNSSPISNAVPTSNYGSLSSIVQRAQQDVSSISGDERQQLDSAIGTKATGEVLTGKQWVPEFKGVSSQLWGDAGIQMKGKVEGKVSEEKHENKTGLPDNLKTGIENLSGIGMDDVKVHYNSSKPSKFQALAYTQGTDIHVAPGQKQHLPHEAWHVVQQKQGRVKPTLQMKGTAINNDSSLEREADVMGAKALQSSLQTTQLQKHHGSASVLQRQKTSFPEDYEEQLKEMGVLQKKEQSSPIQFRGGATVGRLSIRTTHVGSFLIDGHAWLSYTANGGGVTTHGTWGTYEENERENGWGYYVNQEIDFNNQFAAQRTTNVDAVDLGRLNRFIGRHDKWNPLKNCAYFAARAWKAVTGERLAYKSFGFIPNPSALGAGIVAANGGTNGVLPAGVLPANRGSSANSASSTASSSIGF